MIVINKQRAVMYKYGILKMHDIPFVTFGTKPICLYLKDMWFVVDILIT